MVNKFKTITDAEQVPGWTSTYQHECYDNLAKELPKNPKVLEIGCGWGRSTWAWLDVLPSSTQYYVLDHFNMPTERLVHTSSINNKFLKYVKSRNLNQRSIFNKIIHQHKNFSIIKDVWEMDVQDWRLSDYCTTNWDLVYLDDDHSYDNVSTWLKLLHNVPIICGDDYNKTMFQGLVKAVDDYSNYYKCKKQILPGDFFVLKKLDICNN